MLTAQRIRLSYIRRILSLILLALVLCPMLFTRRVNARPVDLPRIESQRVELVSRVGGLVTAGIPLSAGTVLMSEGSALVLLDLSSAAPRVLNQQDLNHGIILDLVQADGRFYALTEEGVLMLAQADGNLPQVIGFVPGSGQSLAVANGRIVVAARQAGLRVLQAEPDGSIRSVAVLSLAGEVLDVALAADASRAYVAAGVAGVHVVDLADPAAPTLTTSLPQAAPADAVGLIGSLLVVGSGEQIMVIDPVGGAEGVVGAYTPLHEGRRIVTQDEYLYVADAADGLKILWLAAPDRPVQVYGEADSPASDLWLDGNLLYIAGSGGLRILDVSSRYRPFEVSRLALPGSPQGIAITAGRAFVALGEQGVAIIDIENLSTPRLEQRIPLPGPARDVLVDGDVLYAAAGEAGLAVIDLDVEGGTLRDTLPLPGSALDLAQRARALYVAGAESGLMAVDITYTDAPALAGVLPAEPGQAVSSVTISGKRAYLADGGGLVVVDVTSPAKMGRLTRVRVPAGHVGVNGTELFVLHGDRLTLYDARATAEPVFRRTYIGLGQVSHIASAGDWLFLSGAGNGPQLVVLSMLAPDYPIEADSTSHTGQAYRAWGTASEVWLARGYGGLARYGLTEGGALTPRSDYSVFGAAGHLSADQTRLLVGGQAGWAVLDFQDGAQPQALGQALNGLAVRALALAAGRVAVAAGDQGVALYSLAEDNSPALIAHRETQGAATGVALDSAFVYVADAGGLSIYDSRYLLPVTRVATPAPANGVVLHGNRAYLPLDDGQLAVVDLADPTGGIRTRSTIGTRRPTDLIPGPDSRYLYGLADDRLLRFRVDNPDRLIQVAEGDLIALAVRGASFGEQLWTLTPGEAVRFYDARGLGREDPAFLGRIEVPAVALVGDGEMAYAAYGPEGLGWVDVATRSTGPIFYQEPVNALYRDGSVLIALGTALTAWDISQPTAPELVATLPLSAPGVDITPAPGGQLLLGLESGLAIVAWDGENLLPVGQLATASAVDHAAQVGQRAYLGLHQGGLLVVDVTDPTQLRRLFSYSSPSGQFVHDLLPLDERTLLVSWEGGIDALDVSAATTTPRLESIVETGRTRALDFVLEPESEHVALAAGSEGVLLLDMTDTPTPRVVGLADTPGDAQRVALQGNTLYVADGMCGLRVIDIADVTTPRERGYWRSSFAGDVAIGVNGLVYLAEANQLFTLRYTPDAPPQLPPIPQFPQPSDGQDGLPLTLDLAWGPPMDSCNLLSYNIFLGVTDNPPFIGQVSGEPTLQVGDLDPLRTYTWWVEATDRQGDTIQGPVWHFTTAAADFPDNLPPAPPLLIKRARQNPLLAAGLITVALLAALLGGLYWRRRAARAADAPDWYFDEE